MPISNNIGYSKETYDKQYWFSQIIRKHVTVASRVIKRNVRWCSPFYHYYDINAGNGFIKELNLFGSPILFTNEILKHKQSCKAFFVEKNQQNAEELVSNLHKWISQTFSDEQINIDNQGAIISSDNVTYLFLIKQEEFENIEINNKNTFGLLYHDPNGLFDHEYLSTFSTKNKFMDILINVNSTAFKRCSAVWDSSDLKDAVLDINKAYWLIRNPIGKMQWTFLLGVNWNKEDAFSLEGFYPLKSQKGQEIWESISINKKQRQATSPLFEEKEYPETMEEYRKTQGYKRIREEREKIAGAFCERCKELPHTELHHICYVDFRSGDVDKLGNVVLLCHSCHSEIHEKNQFLPKES